MVANAFTRLLLGLLILIKLSMLQKAILYVSMTAIHVALKGG